ncbi:MAG TPA: DUF6152 family protein [Terrimicrobiaceae bacterium]|nr:DUF6152 family protein [Terrimicrobiaceae bacterium]
MKRSIYLAVGVAASLSVPVLAHHSFAMFDNQKDVTLEGTIKEFQWTNPHSWIQVMVKDPSGKEVEWSIEGGSPNSLSRNGWKRTSLKPGDKVVVVTHPLKDGSPGGSLVSVSVNGQLVGNPRR